jgi:hypothetical protein
MMRQTVWADCDDELALVTEDRKMVEIECCYGKTVVEIGRIYPNIDQTLLANTTIDCNFNAQGFTFIGEF